MICDEMLALCFCHRGLYVASKYAASTLMQHSQCKELEYLAQRTSHDVGSSRPLYEQDYLPSLKHTKRCV